MDELQVVVPLARRASEGLFVPRLRVGLTGFLVMLLLTTVTGCPKKKPSPPPAPDNSGLGGSLGRAPEGGSTTLPGKIRDRAVDTQIMNEMHQVKAALEADFPNGKGPANTAAWRTLLRDFRILHGMLERGELIANSGVDLRRQSGAVLMYEPRAAKGDGIVLLCDGRAIRVTSKEEFDALPKPNP